MNFKPNQSGECYDMKRESDSSNPRDAQALLVIIGVGGLCLLAWVYGVSHFAEWLRK